MADQADSLETPALDVVLAKRGHAYGDFDDLARTVQDINSAMHDNPGWKKLGNVQMEALEMIAVKMARVINGANADVDNWVDIQGYAKLGQRGEGS